MSICSTDFTVFTGRFPYSATAWVFKCSSASGTGVVWICSIGEKHSVSKIIGSPPGYVGFDEGGQLSEKVRRNPYSVVLFDEIEKAHPDVFNILLQVLDDGHITDSQGRKVDFKNTIIIMTSNAGAQSIIEPKKLGFGSVDDEKKDHDFMKNGVMEEVRRIFKPEFLNRIDETIVFRALNKADMKKIVSILTKDLEKRCKNQLDIELVIRDTAKEYVVEKSFDRKYGARPLKRKIQEVIEDRLAEEIIKGNIKAGDKVIIATGGKAGSTLGSDGSGYALLKGFGHKITEVSPSLVQIKTETEFVRKLKGIKVNAKVTLGQKTQTGELLFADYGISGPPVFWLSSYLGKNEEIAIDFMPEYDYETVYGMICTRCAYLYDLPLEEFFVGMLNKRVSQAILKYAGIEPLSRPAHTLSEKEIRNITTAIKELKLKIEGTASWNNAQVTKGGAVVSQFDSVTMQSKLVKGLYACGEILDIDGDCGGYNLQWAWSSGYLAGISAGKG